MANCFVIMPFRPELGFLYRALKQHIETAFPNVTVARGDDSVLTGPLLEKIFDYVREADVVVADCSGRNPNVFYELGMAHALDKPVVLVTSDPIEHAPTDIRAFEFISYSSLEPEKFLARLDIALQSVIGNPYVKVYPEALALFQEFISDRGLALTPTSKDKFVTGAMALRSAGQHLPLEPGRLRTEFLVRRLLGIEPQIDSLVALKDWLDQEYPP